MPRYRMKRSSGGLKSGLSYTSTKRYRSRQKRAVTKHQDHEVEDIVNQNELLHHAVEGLLLLKGNGDVSPKTVRPNPKVSPFIVSPLASRSKRTPSNTPEINPGESKDGTPQSSRTPRFSTVPTGETSPRKKLRQRDLVKEFGGIDAPVQQTNKNDSTMWSAYPTLGQNAQHFDSPADLPEDVTPVGNAHMNSPDRSDWIDLPEGDTTRGLSPTSDQSTQLSAPSPHPLPGSIHWRYENFRLYPRKEFYRLTGVYQENFEVIYKFLGGDEVCDHLKYAYQSRTPRRKRPSPRSVKADNEVVSAKKKSPIPTWRDTTQLSSKDKLFLTLVRLRRGLAVEDLALIFGLSKTQVSTIFFVWVQLLSLQFGRIREAMCVTRHDQEPWKIAPCFRRYKNFRMVLDTTEIRIQAPRHYKQQGNTYSSYKSANVILYMIGISGWGSISFVSPGFEGSMSDRQIFKDSRLMEYLEPGDLILVDRGFTIKDIVEEFGVIVVHPPFTDKGKPLSAEDLMLTKRIGSDRSHVERAIRKLKCFNILKHVTNRMLPILDQMVFVCACLVNFDANNVR